MLTVLKEAILDFIQENTNLFERFESIYVFGSSINRKSIPNDIDLLLIYSAFCNDIISDIECISCSLEEKTHIPIHLTVLSIRELESTNFLHRIKSQIKLR